MSQLATIFEKIKEDFFANNIRKEDRANYNLIFSPFSTGFTYDDFLFLDSNKASEDAHKYMDELYEFSQIANTIPKRNNFWAVSGDQNDYLFNPYKNILQSLRLLDPDTLNIKMFYDHPIFLKALNTIDEELRAPYHSFFELRKRLANEICELKKSLSDANREMVDLEIEMKKRNLKEVENKWLAQGAKKKVETKILATIKDEFGRFMRRFTKIKGQLETLVREHAGSGSSFYLTYCMPNNLFKGDELKWKKIEIKKEELKELLKRMDIKKYEEVFGTTELSKLEIETIHFELIFVNITRAWYDESILSSPFWDINILNKSEIDIPRITSKLIFIRKVDVKLPQTSNQNKVLLQKKVIQNLGPFIINTSHLKANKNIQLKSVNKSLNIDRKLVHNVSAKINNKQQNKNKKLSAVISKKQHQFIALAPQLRKKRTAGLVAKKPGVLKSNLKINPMVLATVIIHIKCVFIFFQRGSDTPVNIRPNHIKVLQQNKPVNIRFMQQSNNTLVGNLTKGVTYKLIVMVEGYETLELQFKAAPYNNKAANIEKIVQLNKEVVESIAEDLQLIGVIAKKIAPFPNPVKGADYL